MGRGSQCSVRSTRSPVVLGPSIRPKEAEAGAWPSGDGGEGRSLASSSSRRSVASSSASRCRSASPVDGSV